MRKVLPFLWSAPFQRLSATGISMPVTSVTSAALGENLATVADPALRLAEDWYNEYSTQEP
jgi:hypothetical protein